MSNFFQFKFSENIWNLWNGAVKILSMKCFWLLDKLSLAMVQGLFAFQYVNKSGIEI